LVNLLSNAIKFSKSGVILLTASVKSQHGEQLEIQISVSDEVHDFIYSYLLILKQGCGIPESSKPLMFMPFMQADTSITRQYGGSGIHISNSCSD
jgi:signal transduction histidine kinase